MDPLREDGGGRTEIVLDDGSSVTGTILSDAAARRFIEEHNVKRKNKQPCLIVHRANDDYDIMPWAEVLDVRRTEGEGGKNAFLQSSLNLSPLLE